MSATSAYAIEIDATNIAAAVILESRLSRLAPTTAGLGSSWIVEIPGPVNLEDVEAVVRGWLDDLGQRSTTMRIDKRPMRIDKSGAERTAPAHRASHGNFIG